MNDKDFHRKLIFTPEFTEYLDSLDERTQNKFGECITLLREVRILSTKLVKKLVETDENLYELRVSVGYNEYRSILFSANHDNIILATEVVVLNGFLKKDKKDYKKYIRRAINILNDIKL